MTQATMATSYIGRFAPSPTGLLHLGSLYAAVASYLDAKANQGKWLLRIEDLDPPREQTGASQAIIDSLKAHQLHWDGEVIFQSTQLERYTQRITELSQQQHIFYCDCTRQQLLPFGGFYNGKCRQQQQAKTNSAIRFKVTQPISQFNDRLLGTQQQQLPSNVVEDFIIKRKDGLFAYQLAVVADDIASGVTHVVRGHDIIDSTYKQLQLYSALQQPAPQYLHLPVIMQGDSGQKLSKQNYAEPINNLRAAANLQQVLGLLNQDVDQTLTNCKDILQRAVTLWQPNNIKACHAIALKA